MPPSKHPGQTGLQTGLLMDGGSKFPLEHQVSKTEIKEAKPHSSAHTCPKSMEPGSPPLQTFLHQRDNNLNPKETQKDPSSWAPFLTPTPIPDHWSAVENPFPPEGWLTEKARMRFPWLRQTNTHSLCPLFSVQDTVN